MNKTLIVYFSASGVTKRAAQALATQLQSDILEIIPKQIYTDEDLNWNNPNSRSSIEIKDLNYRPEIEDIKVDINNYDTLYILFPIWWGIAPNVIKTFLDKIDLTNKKIVTFCTSGGSPLEPATEDLKRTYPGIYIISGKRV